MATTAFRLRHEAVHPVHLHVEPALEARNRLTTAFRLLLALPHLILVGGPAVLTATWVYRSDSGLRFELGNGGVLGAVAFVVAVIAWFAILFTGRFPEGLWKLVAYVIRWRVRAIAYMTLLRDEYPPFGEGDYPAWLELQPPTAPRDRLSVALRPFLVIPQLIVVAVLGVAWFFTTVFAWFEILVTGRYSEGLYRFGVGVLRWSARVEAYALLLHDEYPPFSLE